MANERVRVAMASVIVGAALLAGCGTTVSGEPVAQSAGSAPRHVPADLKSMLIEPTAFPAPYTALELPPQEASQAAQDLSGVAAGAKVDPPGCTAPQRKKSGEQPVVAVGTDNAKRATISVELARATDALGAFEDRVKQCPDVTTTIEGATASVRSELLPPPPLDADSTLALSRSIRSGVGSTQVTQSMLTLIAQIGDVRVSATHMTFGGDKPDTAALDQVFTEAVQRVRDA